MNQTTAELLAYDPIQAAEDLTGRSCHDDETGALGLLFAMGHNHAKQKHLVELDDTTLSNKLDRYIRIITDLGFEQVLCVPFKGMVWKDEPAHDEQYFIFAHREYGLLLSFDTYTSEDVNGGKLYYCWRRNDPTDASYVPGLLSSGSFCDYDSPDRYWAGNHDCREAIRHKINNLLEHGTFLPKWPADHGIFLWLLHHMDTKVDGYDYKAINEQRISMLPQWVQEMIGR